MTRPFLIAGFALLSVAATAAFVLAPRPSRTSPTNSATNLTAKRPTKPSVDPVDVLVAQLHRRFSDTRDADFGFSRISRPLARMHYGVTMDRNDLLYATTPEETSYAMNRALVRKTKNDDFELRTENGTWIPFDRARDQMRPENAAERAAVLSLMSDRREVAIYTFGDFENGRTERAHGPAYLCQLGPEAPEAEALKNAANVAWAGGRPTLPGYDLRFERIFAEASCVKCHNELYTSSGTERRSAKEAYRKGQALGLIVIAEKMGPG